MKLRPLIKEDIFDTLIRWNDNFWNGLSQNAINAAYAKVDSDTPPHVKAAVENMQKTDREIEKTITDLRKILAQFETKTDESVTIKTDKKKTDAFLKKFIDQLRVNKGDQIVNKITKHKGLPKIFVDKIKDANQKTKELHALISKYKGK